MPTLHTTVLTVPIYGKVYLFNYTYYTYLKSIFIATGLYLWMVKTSNFGQNTFSDMLL